MARQRKTAMKTRRTGLNVAFSTCLRPRWGKLQSRVLYALIDGNGEASTRAISEYCRDGKPTEREMYSQRRAARSIGAQPVRRVRRQWIWRLDVD
jgi:hypothetical protein